MGTSYTQISNLSRKVFKLFSQISNLKFPLFFKSQIFQVRPFMKMKV